MLNPSQKKKAEGDFNTPGLMLRTNPDRTISSLLPHGQQANPKDQKQLVASAATSAAAELAPGRFHPQHPKA